MKTTSPLRIILGAFIMATLALILPATAYSENTIEDHIIETETGIYYIVQPGDTLWDLSQKFSDSAWLWPDLWNENQQITNPHLIYPGDRIKLYRRTDVNRIHICPFCPWPETCR
jgi:peptide methionine sulfoxide reductase MsrB